MPKIGFTVHAKPRAGNLRIGQYLDEDVNNNDWPIAAQAVTLLSVNVLGLDLSANTFGRNEMQYGNQ